MKTTKMIRFRMGPYFHRNLFPITLKHKLNVSGVYEFKAPHKWHFDRELIVGVWSDNSEDYHYDNVLLYLLVKVAFNKKEQLYTARVKGRLSKDNVILDDRNYVVAGESTDDGAWIDFNVG